MSIKLESHPERYQRFMDVKFYKLDDQPDYRECSYCRELKHRLEFDLLRGAKERQKHCSTCLDKTICPHGRKSRCLICGGGEICEHELRRAYCRICTPECREKQRVKDREIRQDPHYRKIHNLQCNLLHIFKGTHKLSYKNPLLKYIGTDQKFMSDWLNYSKFINCINVEKVHMDFIQPLTNIRRENEEDFHKIFNWKNIRIIPAKWNQKKYDNPPTPVELKKQQSDIKNFLDLKEQLC